MRALIGTIGLFGTLFSPLVILYMGANIGLSIPAILGLGVISYLVFLLIYMSVY
jgi:hypothetical protein